MIAARSSLLIWGIIAALTGPTDDSLPKPWIGRIKEAGLAALSKPQEKILAHGSIFFGTLNGAESWSVFCKAAEGSEINTRKKLPEKPGISWDKQAVVFIVFKGYGYDPAVEGWKPPVDGKAELLIKPLLVGAGVPGIAGPRAILYQVDRKNLTKVLLKWDLKNPPTVGQVEVVESDLVGEIIVPAP